MSWLIRKIQLGARNVNQVIYDLRKNGGIKFDADNEEDF